MLSGTIVTDTFEWGIIYNYNNEPTRLLTTHKKFAFVLFNACKQIFLQITLKIKKFPDHIQQFSSKMLRGFWREEGLITILFHVASRV